MTTPRLWIPLAAIAFALASTTGAAQAVSFTFDGASIQGESASYIPEVTADFQVAGGELILTLSYDGSSGAPMHTIGELLSGVTFDLQGFAGTLDATGAVALDGLVGAPGAMDVSDYWAYKDDIRAGGLGRYGIGSAGDILGGADSFGRKDIISGNNPKGQPGGCDFTIAPGGPLPSQGGFQNGSCSQLVDTRLEARFDYTGVLDESMIGNVAVIYGTDGMPGGPTIPEPNSALLYALALVTFGASTRRRTASRG